LTTTETAVASGQPDPVGNKQAAGSSDCGWRWPMAATVGKWFSGRLGSTRGLAAPTKTESGKLNNRCVNSSKVGIKRTGQQRS